jgi:hypothetical protein
MLSLLENLLQVVQTVCNGTLFGFLAIDLRLNRFLGLSFCSFIGLFKAGKQLFFLILGACV